MSTGADRSRVSSYPTARRLPQHPWGCARPQARDVASPTNPRTASIHRMTGPSGAIASTLAVVALAGALAYGAVTVEPSATSVAPAVVDGLPPGGGDAPGWAGGAGDRSNGGHGMPGRAPDHDYLAPTATLTVLRPFERPPQRWAAGHRGVDLAAGPGEPVRAPADGTVAFAGVVVDRRVLAIAHPDGRRSSLEPVDSDLSPGAVVRQGDLVGHVEPGSTHCPPLSCVHWGVREGESYLDPLTLIAGRGPVVLLPGRDEVRPAPNR